MKRWLHRMGMFFFILVACFALEGAVRTEASLVIDPGHDSDHVGASANGVREEELNLKIAKYCVEELQTYQVVGDVHMTRNGSGCPHKGTDSTECNKRRVDFAKSVGADLYVSIHNNSSPKTSVRGASVYYPNGNYRTSIGTAGKRLAGIVMNKLVALGLQNRGTLIRNSEDGTKYPNGSVADYYGVIKNSKLAGFTAIIIEHAFVSNKADVASYLTTEKQLKLLGIADAAAIAEYYGWPKKPVWDRDVSKTAISTSFDSSYSTVTVRVTGLSKALGTSIAVWSDQDGQDDLKWYGGKKQADGSWTCQVRLADFKDYGKYSVHVYGRDEEVTLFARSSSFSVAAPFAEGLKVEALDETSGELRVRLLGASAKAGIDAVSIAMWSEEDQSDLKWMGASRMEDGSYVATCNAADFRYRKRTYDVHAYITDGNGMSRLVQNVRWSMDYGQGRLSVQFDEEETLLRVQAWDVPFSAFVSHVKAAVWSEEKGQDDLVWYDLAAEDSGWSQDVFLNGHATSGAICVHLYGIMKNGADIFLGEGVLSPSREGSVVLHEELEQEAGMSFWKGQTVSLSLRKPKPVTGDGVTVSGNGVAVSGDGVTVSGDGVTVSGDSVTVSGNGVTVTGTGAELEEKKSGWRMRERIFSLKDDIGMFRLIRELLEQRNGRTATSFVLRGVWLVDEEGKEAAVEGEIRRIRLSLPKSFSPQETRVYRLVEENGYVLQEMDPVVPEGDGLAFDADACGLYVMALDRVRYKPGDVNRNGKVDLSDVTEILRQALGIIGMNDDLMAVADINGDGVVNMTDAQMALRIAVGIG